MNFLRYVSLLWLPLLAAAATFAAAEKPNIILLMSDDHGWVETGYNGHPYLQTPVLDEMAATGLRFDRFYSGASTCTPTRVSFLTGRHPNRSGAFKPNWSTRPEEITLAQLLQKAGYRTAHYGKWHIGTVKAGSPLNPGALGFDEWLSHDNFFEIDPEMSRNGAPPELIEGESSEILIEESIRFIDAAQAEDQPFLIVCWFGSPHEPYIGLPEDLALYDNLPEKYAKVTVSLTSLETGEGTRRPALEVLRERFAEITAMDRAIGTLRDHLQKTGLRKNTLLLYCGDNGIPSSGNFENPLRGQKGDVYEGGLLVPGVLEWPAVVTHPRVSSVPVVTSDLLPTLCNLLGISLPDRPLDGISLKPLLEDRPVHRPTPIFFWNYDHHAEMAIKREPYIDPAQQVGTTPLRKKQQGKFTRTFTNLKHPVIRESDYGGELAVIDNRYKLVVNGSEGTGIELFDIQADPYETTNLANEFPEMVEAKQRQLVRWQNSVLHSLTGGDYNP